MPALRLTSFTIELPLPWVKASGVPFPFFMKNPYQPFVFVYLFSTSAFACSSGTPDLDGGRTFLGNNPDKKCQR
jgi:hypothetical protein